MTILDTFQGAWPYLVEGFGVTLQAWIISIIIGMVLGLIACLLKLSKFRILRFIAWVYIWIIRGTPMIVQAFVVYFGFSQALDIALDPFTAGVVTLSLNAGAYLAEIFRSGIQAVPKGQSEAARSLGMSAAHTTARIVLPQAFKIAVPPMVNQFIITLKDTSILTVIGMGEIVSLARQYIMIHLDYFQTYICVAVFYLIVISLLMLLSNYIEKKIGYDRKAPQS